MNCNKLVVSGLLLLNILIACGNKKEKDSSHFNNTSVLSVGNLYKSENDFSDSTLDGFSRYWQVFRKSVITSDTSQLSSLTFFPLQTRGTFDNDPVVYVSREKFTKLFFVFLKQWNGNDLEGSTEMDYIKKVEHPTVIINNNHVRIGNMAFHFEKGRWTLNFLYLNEETTELLKK